MGVDTVANRSERCGP